MGDVNVRNLVNLEDARRLGRKLHDGGLSGVVAKLRGTRTERVARQWEGHAELAVKQWWEIDACQRRWRKMISGDPDVDFPQYAVEKYLSGRTGLRALSFGCGIGEREIRWAQLGVFGRIDGYDLAPLAIEEARQAADDAGVGDVCHFHVADVMAVRVEPGSYDVALGLHALHHFAHVGDVIARLADAVGADGLLMVDDFVGPTRFQWTERQLEAAEGLLRVLPERYRVVGGQVRRRVIRPSELSMRISDPSEAIEAERIMPAIHQSFDVLEEHLYGGSVLQLTFTDIAQNFQADDEETQRLLEFCFEAEDRLMAEGEVGSDFVALVARPKGR